MAHAAGAPPGGVEAPPGLQGAADAEPDADPVEAVKEALRREVDAKVAEKMEEIMREGRAMVLQAQRREEERAEGLAAELEICRARQSAMEAENEHLRRVVAGIASRLAVLAMPFGPTAGLGLSPSPPGPDFAATPRAGGAAEGSDLPEVPTFPFAAPQPCQPGGAAGPPVSLAEALGPQPARAPAGPGPTQLSLASSLVTGLPREAQGAAGRPDEFSFTLRKADGTDLGLSVSQDGQTLLIEAVRSDGAVEAWNKSCAGGPRPERVVGPGDRIVGVNGVTEDPERMLEECESQQLLRLTVRRDGASAAASGHEGGPTTMRADASEFVPMGAFSPPAAPGAVMGA